LLVDLSVIRYFKLFDIIKFDQIVIDVLGFDNFEIDNLGYHPRHKQTQLFPINNNKLLIDKFNMSASITSQSNQNKSLKCLNYTYHTKHCNLTIVFYNVSFKALKACEGFGLET
jgi:hypothetical protein